LEQKNIWFPVAEKGELNKIEERYLKYRYYYAGIDIAGFGGYGKAVYDYLLPLFDQWYMKKSLRYIPPNIDFLKDRLFLVDHPDYKEERGGTLSFHVKVLALSMIGVIMSHNKYLISKLILQNIISDISNCTKSYDYSDRVCFSITVKMFIDMLKNEFSHFGATINDLSFCDFANEETLNPKPPPVINVL
jgi:hypothetical protein